MPERSPSPSNARTPTTKSSCRHRSRRANASSCSRRPPSPRSSVHRKRQRAERLALGPAWTDTGYVFVDEAGQPYHPQRYLPMFQPASARAGVPTIRLHDRAPHDGDARAPGRRPPEGRPGTARPFGDQRDNRHLLARATSSPPRKRHQDRKPLRIHRVGPTRPADRHAPCRARSVTRPRTPAVIGPAGESIRALPRVTYRHIGDGQPSDHRDVLGHPRLRPRAPVAVGGTR